MSRVLGILGGMSWVSTQDYYRLINEGVAKRRGGQHSAELLLASVDFHPVVKLQARGDWQGLGDLLAARAQGLQRAGATAILIASNTMHLVLSQVEKAVDLPALNLFDATAAAIAAAGLKRVGLLGTRYTMGLAFYRDEYAKRGIEVVVPNAAAAAKVNEIIFRELIHNVVTLPSQQYYRRVVADLAGDGAQGVILGCTEIGLLLKDGDSPTPLFDTTVLHAAQAVQWLLGADER